jgi:speckle-type POZ protein
MPIPQKRRKVAMSSAEKSSPPASAIIANTSRGYHILKIDGYSNTKGIPTGEALQSCQFNMCGYHWLISYYPNGDHSDCTDYISLFLVLDETDIEEVKARLKFRFVGSKEESLEVDTFDSQNRSWGHSEFIKIKDLEKSKLMEKT